MKIETAILFIFLTTNLYAQEESKWVFGIEFSEDNLSGENFVVTGGVFSGYRIENTELNYSIGLLSEYNLNEGIRLNSGIFFSNKDVSGAIICNSCDIIPVLIKQQYLSLPISISYRLLKTKIKPHLELGFINNIGLVNEIENSSEYFSGNGYFFEGFAGLSLSYKLGKNLEAEIGYNYRTALTPMYKETSVGDYTRNNVSTIGMAIGLKYVLK